MKLGIIYYRYPLFPQGSYIQEYVDTLSKRTEETVLIATKFPEGNFPIPSKLKIIWIPDVRLPFVGDLLFNLFVFIACFSKSFRNVDVINTISARGTLGGYLASKILRKPTVCTIEIVNDEKLSRLDGYINQMQKFIYSLDYNHIISWSHYYLNKYLLPWGIKKNKITVIPGGIDLRRYNLKVNGNTIRKQFPLKSTLIVFAKPLFDYNSKMAQLLLASVALLKKKHDIRVLLGSGEQVEVIKHKATTLGISEKITIMPYVPITEIPKYIAAADMVVLPYTYAATTSRSLIESMAMGKPIITTNVGEISKVVTSGIDALVVRPNKKQIASAIEKLIVCPSLSQKIGKNARKTIEVYYGIDTIVDRTFTIMQKVIRHTL